MTAKIARKIELMPRGALDEAAECLKVMAHPLRLRIADILMQGEFPVGQIAAMCGLPPHQASEHLRLMKAMGLLDLRREGRVIFYSIANPRLPHLIGCIKETCEIGKK